ncbi:MAG TPA: Yip1 family protein, partial [Candidatus Polarisedimenticolia bacterium]|nr:Yip1 family protein [Candidatus Polarisedimenticolia bacterium]
SEPPVVQAPPPWSPAPPADAAPATPLSPWTSIFTRPRAVMRQILDRDPSRRVHLLALLGGIVEMLGSDTRVLTHVGMPLGGIIALKVTLGALTGLLVLYLGSGLLLLTGRWLGGRGSFVEVRSATAWSNVPAIWSALLWLPLLGYLGFEAFNLDADAMRSDPIGLVLLVPIGIAGFVLLIWRLVIYCKCLGEAHRFSAWHSLGAALIAVLLVGIPLAVMMTLALALGGLALLRGA